NNIINKNKKNNIKTEIVIGNAHYSDENIEVKYARENNIELEHFPRLLEKYFIKKNSVVIAGTYAKTTMTAMASWIFEVASKNPCYMLGGIPLNFQHGASLTKSNISIAEGDEYPAASPWDYSSKFDFYHPKYLILTSAEWDHFDIFKTKKSYIDTFINLVKSLPRDGLIIAKYGGENLNQVLKYAKCKIVYYSCNKPQTAVNKNFYYVTDKKISRGKVDFSVLQGSKLVSHFKTSLIGDFNLENWCAVIALSNELRLDLKKIQNGVESFKGVKRRLEMRGIKNKITVIDDFAHSPSKARGSVEALREYFPNGKIFVVFEPNRGGRSLKCMANYKNVFVGARKVFVPNLTTYKAKQGVYDVSGQELAFYLNKKQKNAVFEPDNKKIIANLKKIVKLGDVVAFMGSRDFDTTIKQLLKTL
ncbi:MAG: Mur ligase family protein, partial [Patescibacteria group bacterium]